MALQAKYQEYLAKPTAEALADNASLNYVPTTTSLSTPSAILKHLTAQHLQVEKKGEKFLNVIEGANSICVETETTLHFLQGGGVYLLNLDDNFLTNKKVVLPVTHIVIFDAQQKIQQIRLLWDQGCLLKGVETIGARGRNWPIRDGPDQIKMIVSSAAAAPTLTSLPDEERRGRGIDPHASLKLFAPQPVPIREESPRHSVAPRESAKPPPREWSELFVDGHEEPIASPERSLSPNKRNRENSNPLKAGAGKHYHESRLFHDDKTGDLTGAGEKEKGGVKTSEHKYDHFEFGEAEFKPKAVDEAKPRNKHLSQWDFQDFVTPVKPPARKISHHQPTLKWDAEAEASGQKSPVYRKFVPQPRPDAKAHFQFEDETPQPARTYSNRPASSASSGGLYEDHILGAYHTSLNRNTIGNGNGGETDDGHDDLPLKTTNPNQHKKTFSAHWDMTDASPGKDAGVTDENLHSPKMEKANPTARSQDRHWEIYDDSPAQKPVAHQGIKIQGDGMGKRKQGEKNWWEYDEQ